MKNRILICDDEESWAKAVQEFLSPEYLVSVCTTVQESIGELKRDRLLRREKRFSVAVIDLTFRKGKKNDEFAGLEILAEAKKCKFIEPVICTGTGNEAKVYEALSRGAFQYVKKQKAAECQLLRSAIEDAIESNFAILGLAKAIDLLAKNDEPEILEHVTLAFKSFRRLRGRD